jgi:hypothetical protein
MSERVGSVVMRDSGGGDWRREAGEVLKHRVSLLDGKDEALMQIYLEVGSSYRRIGRLTGVNEVTVARRIRAMSRRLVNGRYLECLRHRRALSAIEMDIAKAYYLQGLPINRITAENGWSYYRIRTTVAKINRLVAESLREEREGRP